MQPIIQLIAYLSGVDLTVSGSVTGFLSLIYIMMTVKTIVLLLASAQLQAQRVDKCSWFVLENGKADLYGVENYETVFEYPKQFWIITV